MKNLMTAFAALFVGTATLFAQQPQQPPQGPQGGRPEAPKVLSPEEKTAQMAQDYELTAEQEAAVLELNKQYDGKLEFRMEGFGQGNGERKDPRNMTDAEREEFFEQMQERMAQMQEKQAQMDKDQKAYDKALKDILNKEQFKAYRKDQKKKEQERQQRMGGPRNGMGGPGGFPGGGMGGPGGFGGGGFGGGFEGGF